MNNDNENLIEKLETDIRELKTDIEKDKKDLNELNYKCEHQPDINN